jgi:hypothetical protein
MQTAEADWSYLYDAKGNQVTPKAATSGRPDPLPERYSMDELEYYHKAHGNVTPGDKSKAERESWQFHWMWTAKEPRGDTATEGMCSDDEPCSDDDSSSSTLSCIVVSSGASKSIA